MIAMHLSVFLFLGVSLISILKLISAGYPLPDTGKFSICYDLPCMISTIQMISEGNEVIVAVISNDFSTDPYLPLYLGQIVDSFSLSKSPLHYLLTQCAGQTILELAIMVLTLLPSKSVFVSFEDGPSSFGIYNLAFTRVKLGISYAPSVVLHLNHEQPWITQANVEETAIDRPNSLVWSQDDFKYLYTVAPVIIRNYYYEPYTTLSSYVPLGAPMYGYLINNPSSHIASIIDKPASLRSTYCHFTGRTNYPYKIQHEQANERKELFTMAGQEGGEDVLYPCTVSTGNYRVKFCYLSFTHSLSLSLSLSPCLSLTPTHSLYLYLSLSHTIKYTHTFSSSRLPSTNKILISIRIHFIFINSLHSLNYFYLLPQLFNSSTLKIIIR